MTERLYYTDCYLAEFEATVLASREVNGVRGVVLDRTAFYPTSGGQPFDVGVLGGVPIVDVFETDDGTIVHVVEGDPPSGVVTGRVQWDRRFEHMQQHTGQHVLSAAFDQLIGVPTVGFHLGSAASTIDLAREVTPDEIARAEDAANRVAWEDRPVTIRFVDAAEAATLPLRKETARIGRLRIVDVEGFDVSACGGTHVARTGAIGIIVVSAWERFKGASRLEFHCGVRALAAHRTLRDATATAARLLSAGIDALPQGIERLQAENRELRKRTKELEASLAVHEADALAARAVALAGVHVVIESLPAPDLNGLKMMAQRIASKPAYAAVLVTDTAPCSIVIARAADVGLDAAELLKQLTATFGGKGGGRAEIAQGGGLNGAPGQILTAARSLMST